MQLGPLFAGVSSTKRRRQLQRDWQTVFVQLPLQATSGVAKNSTLAEHGIRKALGINY
jgi:hypothetical protein